MIFICTKCGKRFMNSEALRLHLYVDHLIIDKIERIQMGDVEL